MKIDDFLEGSKGSFFPKFQEERPPAYFYNIMLAMEHAEGEAKREALRQMGYFVLLGHSPATVISLTSLFVQNGNRVMYGSALGRLLEQRYNLPPGSYTKGRYYEDRVGRILRGMVSLGILKQEQVKVSGTERMTAGYRLSGSAYQLAKWESGSSPVILLGGLPASSKLFRVCTRDEFLSLDQDAEYCQYCGKHLALACSNCAKAVAKGDKYCIGCGEKLLP